MNENEKHILLFLTTSLLIITSSVIVVLIFISIETTEVHSHTDCLSSFNPEEGVCFKSLVSKVSDGNTIIIQKQPMFSHVNSITLSMISTEPIDTINGINSKTFLSSICPVGNAIYIDEDGDDRYQYDKIGLVFCEGISISLNEIMLENGYGSIDKEQCLTSEFGKEDWAVHHGC